MARTSEVPKQESVSPWVDVPEFELVGLAKLGNISAFEELLSRTTDICLRVATRILRSREDARDELQSAFWIAYSRMELFTYESKFSTWLVRVVINRCYMRLRVNRRTAVLPDSVVTKDGDWYSCEAVTRETPEIDTGRRQIYRLLRRELHSIPPLVRIPIELHYIDERPIEEVARELGLSVAAAKSRLHRGRLYLRDRMSKYTCRRGSASLTES
jgi:RNA polymerase sigma-70 factor, ECF subfamily